MAGKTTEVSKTKANSRDLLTLIDPLCEGTIRDAILESFPHHDFLGEEDVPPGREASARAIDAKLKNLLATPPPPPPPSPSSSSSSSSSSPPSRRKKYLWIVDPIDGTTNFVNGIPLCMPSIAVADETGEVVVGVVRDPHRDETFAAARGRGATMNGVAIRCAPPGGRGGGNDDDGGLSLGDAVVAMGSPPATESMAMSLRALPALMPRVRTIRMLGSAAVMLAWVANGRLSAYWEYDLSSWDVAAGSILIEEAGGRITDLEGERWNLRTRKICGSVGGKVHGEILDTLAEAGVV
ncbi:hypothetical protein ACHAW5_002295 [Stephanodiscus triporus]|uniref:Inositol-phosphate phosphatase n=1 Tax=Stephanodiscus triporus TaxID=2934178 RepID=A0ABD3NJR7_9STRA